MLRFRKKRTKTFPLVYISTFIMSFVMVSGCFAKDIDYKITVNSDGGYSLKITYIKRHWKPITAEGFFPLERKSYAIDIIGKGKDWKYRGQNGYYYSIEDIQSNRKSWDFGYAWVDLERKYLYLNLYWVASPDDIIPSDVNGKYSLTKE
jgi:hypothetical protein